MEAVYEKVNIWKSYTGAEKKARKKKVCTGYAGPQNRRGQGFECLSRWMKSYGVSIHMKATEQFFPLVLFIMLYKSEFFRLSFRIYRQMLRLKLR